MHSLTAVVILSAALCVFCSALLSYRRKCQDLGAARRVFSLCDPFGLPGAALPSTWWNIGLLVTWFQKDNLYGASRVFGAVPLLWGKPLLYSSSLSFMRQVTAARAPLDKVEFGVAGQSLFGVPNVVTALKNEWPRQRKLVTPAFNQQVYRQVWDQATVLYNDIVLQEGWGKQTVVELANVQPLMRKFTLLVLACAGFGLPLRWTSSAGSAKDAALSEAYEVYTENITLSIALPSWAYLLPVRLLHRLKQSRDLMISYMQTIIAQRRAGPKSEEDLDQASSGSDLFDVLLRANERDRGSDTLKDEEIMSNMFILFLAGHDTSAKTLGTALGLLACHPAVQDEVRASIVEVLGDKSELSYDDFDDLRLVQACFIETLRLFPTAPFLIREPLETVAVTDEDGTTSVMHPGTVVICDIIGIGYSPHYFDSPKTFRPSRWLEKEDLHTEDYLFFGLGPRACLGRKFALAEMTCFLVLLLQDWVVEPILREGETLEVWRTRVLEGSLALTFTMGPACIPVRLRRR